MYTAELQVIIYHLAKYERVKGQGHKVRLDENVQSAEKVVSAIISKWHDLV